MSRIGGDRHYQDVGKVHHKGGIYANHQLLIEYPDQTSVTIWHKHGDSELVIHWMDDLEDLIVVLQEIKEAKILRSLK